MSLTQNTRWAFEATIEPSDKVRLRGFIRNEIAFFNALLPGFGSRLRTMPELFREIDSGLLATVAAYGYKLQNQTPEKLPVNLQPWKNVIFDEAGALRLSERALMFFDAVAIPGVLHPEVRRAIVSTMLEAHVRQAEGLSKSTSKVDQVLVAPVELLHPFETRLKRHLQMPAKAVVLSADGRSIRSAYTAEPIRLRSPVPENAKWNVMVVRDEDRMGQLGDWVVELRQEPTDYLARLTDTPLNKKPRRQQRETAR